MTFPINIRTLPLHFLWLFHGQNLKMTSIKDITSALAVASGFWTHFTFIYICEMELELQVQGVGGVFVGSGENQGGMRNNY